MTASERRAALFGAVATSIAFTLWLRNRFITRVCRLSHAPGYVAHRCRYVPESHPMTHAGYGSRYEHGDGSACTYIAGDWWEIR